MKTFLTTGNVFNIQRFSVDDGEGIRTSVFLKGCPLRCKWCHNIESQSFSPEIAFYPDKCINCMCCQNACESGCHFRGENNFHEFRRDNCTHCNMCTNACPSNALCLLGEIKTCEEVMEIVCRDKPFYGLSGGITVTGGEPMAQFEFTYALAKAAKKEKISFVIETSGFGDTDNFKKAAPLCNCFLFDCKAASKDHEDLTGVTDKLILKNLDALCKAGAQVILRCPIVPGGNLNTSFLEKIAGIAEKYPQIPYVELLPYHKTGLYKSNCLGKKAQSEFTVLNKRELEKIKNRLQKMSVNLHIKIKA